MKGRNPHDGRRLLKGRSVRFRLDEYADRITDTTLTNDSSCYGSAKTKHRNPATTTEDVSVEPKLQVATTHNLSLSATEQRCWEKTLQEQYVLDNLLRNNKTPLGNNSWEMLVEEDTAAKEPLRIINLSKRRTDPTATTTTNTTTITTTTINSINISDDADATDQKGGSEALLVKLSRQAVVDPQNLDITLLQYVDYDDTNISLLFNLYNVMIRYDQYHHQQQQQQEQQQQQQQPQQPQEQHLHNHGTTMVTNLLDFMIYLKRIGVLLKSSMVVTLYDVFVQLVQLNPQANIVLAETGNKNNNDASTNNTDPTANNIIIRYHMDRRAIGTHPELLRALPWHVTTRTTKDDLTVVKNHSFLKDWFPFDKIELKNDHENTCTYQVRDCEDVVFPPLGEIDTTNPTDEWIPSLRFGESASCRFLESSCDDEEEDYAMLVGEQLHHPHLQGDSSSFSSSSLDLPVPRRGVKPQPSCGDIQPDSPTNHCLSTSRFRGRVSTTYNTCCPATATAITSNNSSILQGRNHKPTTDITTRTITPIGNDIFSIKGADSKTNNDTTCQQGNIVKTDPKQTQTQYNTMEILAKIDLHGPIPPRDITVVNHHLVHHHQYHDVSSKTTTTTSRATRRKRFFRGTTFGTDNDDTTDMTSTCNFQWLSHTTTTTTTTTPTLPSKEPSFSQLDDDSESWFPPDCG